MARDLAVDLRIEERPCLIVGGGVAAASVVPPLLEAEGEITVVAREFIGPLRQWAAQGVLWLAKKRFEPADLSDPLLVIAATEDEALDRLVLDSALERNLLVHVVARPELGTFRLHR